MTDELRRKISLDVDAEQYRIFGTLCARSGRKIGPTLSALMKQFNNERQEDKILKTTKGGNI